MRKQNTMTFVNLPVVPIFWHYLGTIKGWEIAISPTYFGMVTIMSVIWSMTN